MTVEQKDSEETILFVHSGKTINGRSKEPEQFVFVVDKSDDHEISQVILRKPFNPSTPHPTSQ
jgi:hypothetical protein